MKKILTLLVLVSSLFALVACQSAVSNTKVRVVGLSYSSTETTLATTPSNNSMRLLSNKLVADEVEEYIFPGDILTFTVELEDPNYEFISLLSIKFNDQTIRANVDNSIVTTRDCGANICVDFPFEITADKSEYSVQEVKFAKTNIDGGVNAIIDNQSAKTVVIEVFIDEVFPYVVESVQTLNNAIQNMTFYNDGDSITHDDWNTIYSWPPNPRFFYISGYNILEEQFNKSISQTGTYESSYFDQFIEADYWSYTIGDIGDNWQSQLKQRIVIQYNGNSYSEDMFAFSILFFYFENAYRDIYFYNIGNKIYVNILDTDHFVLEIKNEMLINLS